MYCVRWILLSVWPVLLVSASWAAMLDLPQPGSIQSGIGAILGWKCETNGPITVRFDGGDPIPAVYGSQRSDTEVICHDTDNGFVLGWNWNILGQGLHDVEVFDNGELFASVTVLVATLGDEFQQDLHATVIVPDFPQPGESTKLRWQESAQNFVIAEHLNAPCQDNLDCGIGKYCRKEEGDCNGIGSCQPLVRACALVLTPPVCGCDGLTYTGFCQSGALGISVARQGSCDGSMEPIVCGRTAYWDPVANQCQEREIPPVAGIPRDQALEILDRHREMLEQLPGVLSVHLGAEGILVRILVFSGDRSTPPPTIEGLPSVIEGLPVQAESFVVLPPPDGVLVLQENGEWEEAPTCPSGLQEFERFGWRFCLGGGNFTIPNLMEPHIAGIPFTEAQAILDRHQEELFTLPGVYSVGLGAEGISVRTAIPEIVPAQVEGLPIITDW